MRTLPILLLLAVFAACDTTDPSLTSSPEPTPPPTQAFEALFGTERYDAGHALLPLAEGGLLVAGAGNGGVAPADGTLPYPLLSRLEHDGTVRWTRIYEDLGYGTAVGVVALGSGRFGLLLDLHDDSFRNRRMVLWEVDAEGTLLRVVYERPLAAVPFEATRSLLGLSDGGFLLLGMDRSDNAPQYDFVTRIDAEGSLRWTLAFAEPRLTLVSALPVEDDGFLILGNQVVTDRPYTRKPFVARVGEGGTIRWQKLLDAPQTFEASALTEVEGGFVVAGHTHQHTDSTALVLPYFALLSEAGAVLNTGALMPDVRPQSLYTRALATVPAGGGLALTGWLRENPNAPDEAFAMLFATDGTVHWFERIGEAGMINFGYDIVATGPDALIITGARGPDEATYGGADFDVFVHAYAVGVLR